MAPRPAPVLALLCWLSCSPTGAARAADRDPDAAAPPRNARLVVLDSTDCGVVPADELRELVALELSPRPVESDTQPRSTQPSTRARVSCSATRARLIVHDVERGRGQELELDLAATMVAARTRLVALALSELVVTVEMEPTLVDEQRAQQRVAGERLVTRDALYRCWLGFGLAREGQPRLLAAALQTGAAYNLGRLPMAVQTELLGSFGRRDLAAGRIAAWTLSGSALLMARLRTAWLELGLGAGARLGYARLDGMARTREVAVAGRSVSGVWWGPMVEGSLWVPLHARWGVRAVVDLVYVARSVRGLDVEGRAAYALRGLQLHATVGVTVGF